MQELVTLKNNDIFTDSLVVAKGTGNEHESVASLIKKYLFDFEDFGKIQFTDLKSGKRGRPTRVYQLSEEQATLLVTYLDNTKKVRAFKKELVRQFYAMRKFIMERQSVEWQATRKQGKLTRKVETDTLQRLVEYAKEQGSQNADKLYMAYSKLANKVIGVKGRDNATISQLNNLSLAENIILHCIQAGITDGKHYKEIYQDSKKRLEMFKDIAFLENPAC